VHLSVHRPAVRHASPHYPSGPTSWGVLNAAIARIPTYHPGAATWVIKDTGYWGTSDWYHDIIYISPTVPDDRVFDVAVHEWSHLLSIDDYGGNVNAAIVAMDAWYGADGMMGAEYAADCMAIEQGADWTNYTSCTSTHWRQGAQLLVAGKQLTGGVVGALPVP
jgi:hypothetical protein